MASRRITPVRNSLGFASGSPVATCCTVGNSCSSNTIEQCGNTQGIDNLMVGTIIANQELVGTMVVQGSGNKDPFTEAGLCVKTGARVEGFSHLRDVRIVGTLTTDAPADMEIVSIVQADGLTVGGVVTGPLENVVAMGSLYPALVSITSQTTPSNRQIMGIAVSPRTFLTTNWWTSTAADIASPIPDNVYVTAAFTGLGDQTMHATVIKRSVNAGLALFQLDAPFSFFEAFAQVESEDDAPPHGTKVTVGAGISDLGTRALVAGVVTDPSVSMFAQFSSVHVSFGNKSYTGTTGAPILNAYGKLIGLVQYGAPDSDAVPGTLYTQVIGGIHGRFIQWFLDQTVSAINLPVALAGGGVPVPARGISFRERTPAFKAGGVVTAAPNAAVPTDQIVGLYYGGELHKVGNIAQNKPSLQQLVLEAYKFNLGVDAYIVDNSTSSTFSITAADIGTDVLWSHGSPYAPDTGFCSQSRLSSNFEIEKVPVLIPTDPTPSSIASFSTDVVTPATSGILEPVGVMTFGNSTDASDTRNVLVIWGSYLATNLWVQGLGGAPAATWAAYWAAISPKPNAVYGAYDATADLWSFQAVVLSQTVALSVVKSAATTITVTLAGATTVTVLNVVKPFDIFSFVSSSTGGACSLVTNPAITLVATASTPANVTVSDSTAVVRVY